MSTPPILIAEDEPFVALDLAIAVENAGGVPVGPAGSVREALALIASSEVAAILDVNLSDGDVFPAIQVLIDRSIPSSSRRGSQRLPNSGPATPASRVAKPVKSELLLAKLMTLLGHGSRDACEI